MRVLRAEPESPEELSGRRRSRPYGLVALLLAALLLFCGLGVWQVKRLAWKEALIARVDDRVHAPPVAVPADALLKRGDQGAVEYLRVALSGTWEPAGTVLVRAATDLGTGYWVMTPIRSDDGRLLYVNRGFVEAGTPLADVRRATPGAPVRLTGLLRVTEPGGSLLQSNRPGDDRWYSRDIAAIARSRGNAAVQSIFVDAQSISPAQPDGPVPGLTVIHFPNNHLSYAITWFAMAVLSAVGAVIVWRRGAWIPQ